MTKKNWLHIIVLLVGSCLLYAGTLSNGFVWDDPHLLNSPQIRNGDILAIFSGHLYNFGVYDKMYDVGRQYFRPALSLIMAAELRLFGTNPPPWHAVNLAANALAVILAYLLLRAIISEQVTFVASLLFAAHPVHSEPVAWVAAICELTCAIGIFGGMLSWHNAREGRASRRNFILCAAFFFLALSSKETAVMFPIAIVAYEYLLRRQSLRSIVHQWRNFVPVAAVFLIYVVARGVALKGLLSVNLATKYGEGYSLANVPARFATYVWKLIWPVSLYVDPPRDAKPFETAPVIIGAAFAMVFAFGFTFYRKRNPVAALANAWVPLFLLPALPILCVGERYLYIPSFGFCVLLALAWSWMCEAGAKKTATAALVALLSAYVARAAVRVPEWKDNKTLYESALEHEPNARLARHVGDAYTDANDLTNALRLYERAAELDPHDYVALVNIGKALFELRRGREAIAPLTRAIAMGGGLEAHYNLGQVLMDAGDFDRAAEVFERALTKKAESYERGTDNQPHCLVFTRLGVALLNKPQREQERAIEMFRRGAEGPLPTCQYSHDVYADVQRQLAAQGIAR